jgi:hypothetical protein
MRAVLLHEYGGPEKLKFEDNVPVGNQWQVTVLRSLKKPDFPTPA